MSQYKKILCPIDLSENSFAAIDLATNVAKQNSSMLVFIYVAPQWLPEEAMFGNEYVSQVVEENKKAFMEIRPKDVDVEFDHIFVNGNPGPEIVRASNSCDLVVMSTHGYKGVMRLLMGSVAQYVLRNAKCPVIMFKHPKAQKPAEGSEEQQSDTELGRKFVTQVMRQVHAIHGFEKMDDVLEELNKARVTAAPVIDDTRKCVGILTKTDIDKYHDLKRRFEAGDETVLNEMFEVDQYGQRRPTNDDFDQVRRHMTSPVVTVLNSEVCRRACELFEENPGIHHLVVLDETDHAVGLIEPNDVLQMNECQSE